MEKPVSAKNTPFLEFSELDSRYLTITKAAIVGTIMEVSEKKYKSRRDGTTKRFGKIKLQQNTDVAELIMWDNSWSEHKELL